MVNVAGRSKGCSTCKRRRVKCDETAPVCKRCHRWGLECDGPRGTAFVHASIFDKQLKSTLERDKTKAVPAGHIIEYTVPQSISPSRNKDELILCYGRTYLRPGASIDKALQHFATAQNLSSENAVGIQIFEKAFMSLATVTFGVDHHDELISNAGYALHGRTLSKLNQALSVPEYRISDEAILAVVVLALLEGLAPTTSGAYLSHMVALEKLLELRNPAIHNSTKSINMYRSMRHMLVFASLRSRKATILASPAWKALLRTHNRSKEHPESNLFEVLADCSVLLEQGDALQMAHDVDDPMATAFRQRLKREALSLLSHLQNHSERFCLGVAGSLESSAKKKDSMADSRDKASRQTNMHDSSEEAAITEAMLYYTTLIWIYRVLQNIEVKDVSLAKDLTHLEDTYDIESWYVAESQAAQIVCAYMRDYVVLKTERRLRESPVVHWAVTTAWGTLGVDGVDGQRWIRDLLGISSRSSFVVAKGLLLQ